VRSAWATELGELRPRLLLLALLCWPLPRGAFRRLRAAMLRLVGFCVGPGTHVAGLPELTGEGDLTVNLVIGAGCELDWGCVLELGDRLTLGDGVVLGAEAMILTTSHELGSRERRAGPLFRKRVTIGSGAVLGARSIVLPGVTIGSGAEILAGSVVTRDVPPNTRWGGLPARLIGPVER
jgi:maltose O-acetyltransferase